MDPKPANNIPMVTLSEEELKRRVQDATREIFTLNERLNLTIERLVEANNTQTRFLEDVTHEMKNPLSVISGYSAFLLSRPIAEWKPEELTRILSNVYNYAKHLETLIDDLSDSLRISKGSITLRRHVFFAKEAIDDAVEGMRLKAAEKRLSLDAERPEGETVYADKNRVRQVLVNLLSNAIKFTPEGGKITVSARGEGPRVHFCVADTGCGIEAQHLPKIFDRFYQAPSAQDYKGLGLGLSIVSGLVAMHGGRIWVESEPGRGSRFHFTLPSKKPQTAASLAAPN